MKRGNRMRVAAALIGAGALLGCVESNPARRDDGDNPSPTAGSSTAQRAGEMADKAMYKAIDYRNRSMRGPNLVVIPGDIKSGNATFTQKFGPNNIADFAELELGQANFGVLERSDMGPLLQEFQLAYTMGDPELARKFLQRGKFRTTRWVVKFDVLKAEQVAAAQQGFDGRAIGQLLSVVGRDDRRSQGAGTLIGSIKTDEGVGVWVVGMRFKVLDAATTEQVASGYAEQKMEIGAKSTSVMGFSQGAQGGLTLDSMVQRLVQQLVYEIDAKYKVAEAPPPLARSVAATAAAEGERVQAAAEPAEQAPSPASRSAPVAAAAVQEPAAVPAAPVVQAAAPAAADSAPAVPAAVSPGAIAAAPATPEPAAAPAVASQAPAVDAPPIPAQATATMLAAVAPAPIADREAAAVPPASVPAPVPPAAAPAPPAAAPAPPSQERTIRVGNMTAVGDFVTDPVSGAMSGTGTLTWTDGNRYEGPMVAGRKHGSGLFVWPSGQRYQGDWRDDEMTGNGILQFANGDRYEGQLKNGEPHGTGTYTLRNGDRYVGEWVGGNKHGQGRLTWTSGDYWEGEFRDGRQTDNGHLVVMKPAAAVSRP